MTKYIARLTKADWDENYINFNPSRYLYASSDQTFSISHTEFLNGNLVIKYNARTATNVKALLNFNALMLVELSSTGQTKSVGYYLIKNVETKNASLMILTCIPDAMMNAYMFKGNSKIHTLKTGGENIIPWESLNKIQLPLKDVNIKTKTEFLKIKKNLPYTVNGSVLNSDPGRDHTSMYAYSKGLTDNISFYYETFPEKDKLSSIGSNGIEAFGFTQGKTVVGTIATPGNGILLDSNGLDLKSVLPNNSFIPKAYRLDKAFTEIFANIGGEEISLNDRIEARRINSDYDPTGYYALGFEYNDSLDSYTYQNVTNYKFNLYPANSMYMNIYLYPNMYNKTNKIVIYSKAYRLPKSQQMYNKYQRYMISNKVQDGFKTINQLTSTLVTSLLTLLTGTLDFAKLAQEGMDVFGFFGGKMAFQKDMAGDFVETVGGSQVGFDDLYPLMNLGFNFRVKTYSNSLIENLKNRIKIEGSDSTKVITLREAVNNLTYVQGIILIDSPGMGDARLNQIFKRGVNFIK